MSDIHLYLHSLCYGKIPTMRCKIKSHGLKARSYTEWTLNMECCMAYIMVAYISACKVKHDGIECITLHPNELFSNLFINF